MRKKNTLFIGQVTKHFPSLESTNVYASSLAAKSNPVEGTVISTYSQTHGKGQIGSKWESEAHKNLSLSLILKPTFLVLRDQFLLTQCISLAVKDFLESYANIPVKVKWPNDIYVGQRKIAGILIQNNINSKKIQYSIIGIGLNVNQVHFSSWVPNPTSIALETRKTHELKEAQAELMHFLEVRYLQLKAGKNDDLLTDYLANLFQFREWATYKRPDGSLIEGYIKGIEPSGKLIMKLRSGREESFDLKELKFIIN